MENNGNECFNQLNNIFPNNCLNSVGCYNTCIDLGNCEKKITGICFPSNVFNNQCQICHCACKCNCDNNCEKIDCQKSKTCEDKCNDSNFLSTYNYNDNYGYRSEYVDYLTGNYHSDYFHQYDYDEY